MHAMRSSQDLGRLTKLPNDILLHIIHELIEVDYSGLQTLVDLTRSNSEIRNLFIEYPGSILIHALRVYPRGKYFFSIFSNRSSKRLDEITEMALSFVDGKSNIEPCVMQKLQGVFQEGPIEMLEEICLGWVGIEEALATERHTLESKRKFVTISLGVDLMRCALRRLQEKKDLRLWKLCSFNPEELKRDQA